MKGLSTEQIDEAVGRSERGDSLMRVGHALGVTPNAVRAALLDVRSYFESIPAGVIRLRH